MVALGIVAALVIIGLLILSASVRILREYERGVVFRLGRLIALKGPGLRFLIPIVDQMVRVDLRTVTLNVPPQEVITKDNVVVTVDAIVYYEATDPVKLIYNVVDFYAAATKLAQTNLRNVVGEMELDEALTSREVINAKLREVLDDATDKWGVRVVRVEIKRIDPPADVTQAMHRQMKAEREKRAQILDAEGMRQSRILAAEGEAEAVRRVADAERYRLEVEATGQSNAITMVFGAITAANPTDQLIAVQYIDALKAISNGTASKVFVPYEASALLGALGGIKEIFNGEPPAPARPALPSLPGAVPPRTPPGMPTTPTPRPATRPAAPRPTTTSGSSPSASASSA